MVDPQEKTKTVRILLRPFLYCKNICGRPAGENQNGSIPVCGIFERHTLYRGMAFFVGPEQAIVYGFVLNFTLTLSKIAVRKVIFMRQKRTDIIFLYDGCCIYEIAALNYFLSFAGRNVVFCSPDGGTVHAMEGYSLNTDSALENIELSSVNSFILPGGKVSNADSDELRKMLRQLADMDVVLAAICAGVDLFDKAGVLDGIQSTHSTGDDCVRDHNVITSRANAYVDFAIETAKALNLFRDEQDLQETIDFWKNHKRMQ